MQDALRRLRPPELDGRGLGVRNAQKNMETGTLSSQQTEESQAEQMVVPKLELWSHPIGFGAVVSLCSGARRAAAQPLGSEG